MILRGLVSSELKQSEPSTHCVMAKALGRPTSLLMSLGFFKSSFMDSLMSGHISRAARFSWVRRQHYAQSSPAPAFIPLLLLFLRACTLIDSLCGGVAFDSRSPALRYRLSYGISADDYKEAQNVPLRLISKSTADLYGDFFNVAGRLGLVSAVRAWCLAVR